MLAFVTAFIDFLKNCHATFPVNLCSSWEPGRQHCWAAWRYEVTWTCHVCFLTSTLTTELVGKLYTFSWTRRWIQNSRRIDILVVSVTAHIWFGQQWYVRYWMSCLGVKCACEIKDPNFYMKLSLQNVCLKVCIYNRHPPLRADLFFRLFLHIILLCIKHRFAVAQTWGVSCFLFELQGVYTLLQNFVEEASNIYFPVCI